jgi:gliding motility-associated-like protein
MKIKQIFLTCVAFFLPLFATAQDELTQDSLTIGESKLVFPNAFSPNGDGTNDIFKAKEQQGIAEFHAYIYNRWGQMLYDWTDSEGGWDGKTNGRDVKEGVYFVLVKAKGVDGKVYNIRKDVNLLRGWTNR